MQWTPAKKAVAVCAAIGLGLLVVSSRKRWRGHNGAPVVLDPELDSDTRNVVLTALAREHDPAVLGILATKLDAAGYDQSAVVVRERSISLLRSPHHVGQASSGDGNAHLEHSFGHSAMVWHAQNMLRKLGYDVPVNGVEDARTALAVKRFQSLYDLNIDGIIGPKTNAVLAAAVRENQ